MVRKEQEQGNQYRSRNVTLTAVDTPVNLGVLGSQTAPGVLTVPQGMTHLVRSWSAVSSDHGAANDGGVMFRISGDGLPDGPETIPGGATGGAIATGQEENLSNEEFPIMVRVRPGNIILIDAEMQGEDTGTCEVGLTLEFADLS